MTDITSRFILFYVSDMGFALVLVVLFFDPDKVSVEPLNWQF